MSQAQFYQTVQQWVEVEEGTAAPGNSGTTKEDKNGNQESTTNEGQVAPRHRSPERCWEDL